MTDLLALTADLVDIPSVSRAEGPLVARLRAELDAVPWLTVEQVGDNLVARTHQGRDLRLVLVGHTDTVPPSGEHATRIDGDRLTGLGAADMKGGLAVMVELARTVAEPAVDLSFVFYAREEIAAEASGLLELQQRRPDLLRGDAAVVGEPTSSVVEAGCQGTMRLRLVLVGERAHTARPWMGRNAIHRLGPVLSAVAADPGREPVLAGCRYREALQVVHVEGGVAGNVVPDRVEVLVNHRFAPDRSPEEAEAHVRSVLEPWLEPEDVLEVVDVAPAAAPSVDHPLIATPHRSQPPRRVGQARLDRRGPLRRGGRAGGELRPGRSDHRPHRRRARHPSRPRGGLRGARRPGAPRARHRRGVIDGGTWGRSS